MSCQRSDNGYFESKLVGCSVYEEQNYTTIDNSVERFSGKIEYRLNEITDPYYKGKWEKCVENEPGVVKLEKMPEDYEPVCKVDNVVFKDIWDDDVKGVRWYCRDDRNEKLHSTRFRTAISATSVNMYHGLYWEPSARDEDNYPGEEAVSCAYIDVDRFLAFFKPELVSNQSRLEVGESKMSRNGTVRVKCSRFDGHVRRVSEAFSGCYYNGTVYRAQERWDEPNPGNDSSLWKSMSCQKSDDGYLENKLVGCSIHEIRNYTNGDNSVETWWKKCVESEPGVVKLEKMAEDYEPVCTVNSVVFKDFYDDEVKGVQWECNAGRVRKTHCKIGKNRYESVHLPEELQSPNGCKFICHPQTNIFKCDEALSMFKIEEKPRKMRKYKGARSGLPFDH
ncbi:hypothetical protein L5515_010376 [Caenorhabditis briggsae]|uniref:Uncharacterized protein n=1 Tax=Caenorhabditis briggsae TaxID=6238 RepID=A0AAE9ETG0_CAEBR|nr:hypothetical protein L5515_010376 [Caenorhabditis briggsae]